MGVKYIRFGFLVSLLILSLSSTALADQLTNPKEPIEEEKSNWAFDIGLGTAFPLSVGAMALLRARWPELLPGPVVVPTAAATPTALAPAPPTATTTASPSPVETEAVAVPVAGAASPELAASPEASPAGEIGTAAPSLTELPTPSSEPTPEPRGTGLANQITIRVTDGDTLTDLAVHYYGSASPRVLATIRAANPWLDDPDLLWSGKLLTLPPPRTRDDRPPNAD